MLNQTPCSPKGQFTQADIQRIAKEGKLTMLSGVPIKSVVLLRIIANPVVIARKKSDPSTGKMVGEMDPTDPQKPHPRTKRVYIGGNNHHIEIRQRQRKRKGQVVTEWAGQVVGTFDAAKRNAARLKALRDAGVPSFRTLRRLPKDQRAKYKEIIAEISRRVPIVDRSENQHGSFVMSLAEGEMIFARRKDRPAEPPDYYIVCKLDKDERGNGCIHFAPHWDARVAPSRDRLKEGLPCQDRWDVTPADLQHCGPEPGKPPQKVRVGPLGDVVVLEKD